MRIARCFQESAKNLLRPTLKARCMSSYSAVAQVPQIQELEANAHSEVLVADSRWDQALVRAAVDVVFEAHPALGTVFEPFFGSWTSRPGGGWAWAVEPPGGTVEAAVARQRALFDMRTGRLFAVSLLPGSPERLVLTVSSLCMRGLTWENVVGDLMAEYSRYCQAS
jgi:hypothetical protein